jgi:hypothetical protein
MVVDAKSLIAVLAAASDQSLRPGSLAGFRMGEMTRHHTLGFQATVPMPQWQEDLGRGSSLPGLADGLDYPAIARHNRIDGPESMTIGCG